MGGSAPYASGAFWVTWAGQSGRYRSGHRMARPVLSVACRIV